MKKSNSRKRRIIAAAVAVALVAAMLAGGTLSYSTGETVNVANIFNSVLELDIDEEGAEVDEDTGDLIRYYSILPGTAEDKNPVLTLTATIDSYVFLFIEDSTDGLVTYAVLDDWKLFSESTNEETGVTTYIYYQKVTAQTDADGNFIVQELNILEDGTVSYSSAIDTDTEYETEEYTDSEGNTNTIIKLANENQLVFYALTIQSDPFTSAQQAYEALYGTYFDNEDYTSDTETTLSVTVDTTIASTASEASTQTTVTVTIPSATVLTSSADSSSDEGDEEDTEDTEDSESSITSLTLKVKQVYSADSTDILNDTSYAVGDYTFDISLVDQDGNAVSATSGYIEIAIQAASGLTNRKVYHGGEALSTSAADDGDTYYTYKSSTGVFTIYTQSFSEYEICWRGNSSQTISTAYLQGSYDDEGTSTQTSTATVTTTLANSASSESEYTTTTTFKASVTSDTEITSSTGEITSLYPVVTETTSETTAVVPGGDAGDYTFDISLIDQDGNEVTATSGNIVMNIAIKSGISSLTVTKIEDDGTETTLGTSSTSDGSDYYKYNSSTGALKIYTRSLGEYEISWNDTGLSLSALSGDDLTFTNSSNSKWTFTCKAGVAVNSKYSGQGSAYTKTISYGDWAIEVVMTCDMDISSVYYPIKFTSTQNNYNDMWYTNSALSYTAGTEVGIIQSKSGALGSFQVDEDDGSTKNSYDLKVGVSPKNVSITGASITFELRIYEGSGNSGDNYSYTGNYIVLDTVTVTAN